MSRVGKMPIDVPKGVDVQVSADKITVKGSNGTLTRALSSHVMPSSGACAAREPASMPKKRRS